MPGIHPLGPVDCATWRIPPTAAALPAEPVQWPLPCPADPVPTGCVLRSSKPNADAPIPFPFPTALSSVRFAEPLPPSDPDAFPRSAIPLRPDPNAVQSRRFVAPAFEYDHWCAPHPHGIRKAACAFPSDPVPACRTLPEVSFVPFL